jgi:hypothetical protein
MDSLGIWWGFKWKIAVAAILILLIIAILPLFSW